MPITAEMMKAAASSGLSVVCSSCELYWSAREKGIQGDRCLAQDGCGSPLSNGVFHEYRGPLTTEMLRRSCFVCGAPAVKGLRRNGNPRTVGICGQHAAWMGDPEMRRPVRTQITTKPQSNYLGIDLKELNGHRLPPETSLLGNILKTEKEWADEDGREFDALGFLGVSEHDDGD